METNKASVKKIALNYGAYMALGTIAVSVIVYALGHTYDQPIWQSLLNFAIMIMAIVFGLKTFKSTGDGFMSLGDALKTGLAISLVAAIIGVLFNYIFMNFIEPDFVTNMLEITEEKMLAENPNMTEDQRQTAMDMTAMFMSPGMMAAFGLIASLFFGFIISLIAGLVMKQNRPEY